MSALPPKADMLSVELDVCFVPQADIAAAPNAARDAPGGFLSKFRASETFKHDQRLRDRISGDPLVATVVHRAFSRLPFFRPDVHAFIGAAASDFSGSRRRFSVFHRLCRRAWQRGAVAL